MGVDLRCGGGRVAALKRPPALHSLPLPFDSPRIEKQQPHPKQNQNPAQRKAEVVDEAGSVRAVLILKGGATK